MDVIEKHYRLQVRWIEDDYRIDLPSDAIILGVRRLKHWPYGEEIGIEFLIPID